MVTRGAAKAWRLRILQQLGTLRLALYSPSTNLSALTLPAYTPMGEIADNGGYTAGGVQLSYVINSAGPVPFLEIADPTINAMTEPFRGGVVYDDDDADDIALMVLDFGVRQPTAQNVIVRFPQNTGDLALIRVVG